MSELTSAFSAAPDGVWTEEVGTITGDLELRTECAADGEFVARVRYAGALDVYTIRGGRMRLHDPSDHQPVHDLLTNVLHYPR